MWTPRPAPSARPGSAPPPRPLKPARGRKREPIPLPALQSDSVIVERTATPVLQLTKRYGPDEAGVIVACWTR